MLFPRETASIATCVTGTRGRQTFAAKVKNASGRADQRGDVFVDHIGRCQRTVGRASTGAMLLRRAPKLVYSLIMYRSLHYVVCCAKNQSILRSADQDFGATPLTRIRTYVLLASRLLALSLATTPRLMVTGSKEWVGARHSKEGLCRVCQALFHVLAAAPLPVLRGACLLRLFAAPCSRGDPFCCLKRAPAV
jgi:hypothetical protein